ncbi:MAG: polyhydroxyalkanoate synthesis repressor PhaR [Pseudomonadota bacterium]
MNEHEEEKQEESKRIIKKYPNRRLYDTSESKYVTLSDVRELVLSGISFCVIDKKSGDDITRSILLQIIIEQEEEGEPMFSTDVLEQMIGFYGNSAQTMAGDFIQSSLKLFQQQQEKMQSQFSDALQHNPMAAAFTEVTKRNMALWQEMQSSFFGAATKPPNRDNDGDT